MLVCSTSSSTNIIFLLIRSSIGEASTPIISPFRKEFSAHSY